MQYGTLIRRAWDLSWRHRFLWILAFFAPSTCTGGGGSGGGPQNFGARTSPGGGENPFPPEAGALGAQAATWVQQHLGMLLLAAAVLILLALVWLVVAHICQGAVAQATSDLALGQPAGLGSAWSAGLERFWRYVGLSLVLVAIAIVVALVIAIVVGVGALVFPREGPAQVFSIIGAVLLVLAAIVVAIPVFIAFGVVVTYAQRAIAVEDVGPVAALGAGLRLLRGNLGTSALAWLVSLGLTIGAGIAIAIAAIVALIPLGGIGAALYFTSGLSGGFIAYAVVAVVLFLLLLMAIGAVVSAYFWSFWTLVYLRLTGRLGDDLLPPAPPEPELSPSV
jgi:hypothetical protein